MAFVAGTGVLVFVDLVAHIARKVMGLISNQEENEQLGKDFKFHLFCSFKNKDEAVAMEMLELLD